jgi:hypothetical protein
MASEQQVRRYLAYWFQLGKRACARGGRQVLYPQPVIQGDRYSDEFERCWQYLHSEESGECYLEGTDQTIDQLLSPQWDVHSCARCDMPVPIPERGMSPSCCPCHDLSGWPNPELPMPRAPVSSQSRLRRLCSRLLDISRNSDSIPRDRQPSESEEHDSSSERHPNNVRSIFPHSHHSAKASNGS